MKDPHDIAVDQGESARALLPQALASGTLNLLRDGATLS